MKKGICKLYREEKELIKKSHIIPNSFFKHSVLNNSTKAYMIKSGEYRKVIQTGPFESHILSQEVESHFSLFEKYGKELLIDTNPVKKFVKSGNNVANYYVFENLDSDKLKLFLYSILWRCSISEREEFKNFSIGTENEELLRKFLISKKIPDDNNIFSIIATKVVVNDIPFYSKLSRESANNISRILFNPVIHRIDGLRYAKIKLYDYQFHIKTDSQKLPFSSPLNKCTLSKEKDFPILEEDFFEENGFYNLAKRVVHSIGQ